MQPESCHHARDPFAQGLGPYTEIPVKTLIESEVSVNPAMQKIAWEISWESAEHLQLQKGE